MCSKVETFGVVAVAVLVFAGFALASFPCCSWAQGPGIPATDGPGGGAISSNSPKWTSFTDPKSDTLAKLMRFDSGLQASIAPRGDAEGSRDMLSRYPYPIGNVGRPATNDVPILPGPPEGLSTKAGPHPSFLNPFDFSPTGMLDDVNIGSDEREFIKSHFYWTDSDGTATESPAVIHAVPMEGAVAY